MDLSNRGRSKVDVQTEESNIESFINSISELLDARFQELSTMVLQSTNLNDLADEVFFLVSDPDVSFPEDGDTLLDLRTAIIDYLKEKSLISTEG